jgi:hypothetical protein
MTIKAKFAGHCRVCQSPITVGSEIEWEKGKGSMHVGCKDKTPELLNSAPPAQLINADTDLSALAQQFGFTLRSEPGLLHYHERVFKGEHLKAIGSTFEAENGKVLVIARTKPIYYDQDYLDDMDWFDLHPGLYYQVTAISIERSAEEQAKLDKEAEERATAKAAKAAEEKAAVEKMDQLRKCPDGYVEISVLLRELLPVAWTEIGRAKKDDSYVNLQAAGEYFVCNYGSYDDYRIAVFIPQHLSDEYFAAAAAQFQITKQSAETWLSKYSRCVGHEIYEWAVAHLEAEVQQ